jgi:hypothetical protein
MLITARAPAVLPRTPPRPLPPRPPRRPKKEPQQLFPYNHRVPQFSSEISNVLNYFELSCLFKIPHPPKTYLGFSINS